MKNRRLFIRVVLKSLFFFGFLLLMGVFVNSLFTHQEEEKQIDTKKDQATIVTIDISDMRKGEIRKARWGTKEVAVLYRQFSKKIKVPANNELSNKSSREKLPPALLAETRSINPDYFVFINTGDSGNCPLYYAKGEFNDTCSKNRFDENGLSITSPQSGYRLAIPPHYFVGKLIEIGAWK